MWLDMSLVGCFGLNEPNLLAKQTGNMWSLVETQIHVAVKHKIHEAQTFLSCFECVLKFKRQDNIHHPFNSEAKKQKNLFSLPVSNHE